MERLTERFKNGQAAVLGCGNNCKYDYKYCNNYLETCPTITKIYEKLAAYEDAEEQDRLIKSPCKVGDTVYGISMGKIISLTVNEISIFCMKGEKIINAKCQSNDEFRNYVEREFGKTVFLTKSEAEAKLEELRGGGNGSME